MPWSMLLQGDSSNSDAEADDPQPALLVDEWLTLRVPAGRPSQLAVLRGRLAAAFAFKVCNQGHRPHVDCGAYMLLACTWCTMTTPDHFLPCSDASALSVVSRHATSIAVCRAGGHPTVPHGRASFAWAVWCAGGAANDGPAGAADRRAAEHTDHAGDRGWPVFQCAPTATVRHSRNGRHAPTDEPPRCTTDLCAAASAAISMTQAWLQALNWHAHCRGRQGVQTAQQQQLGREQFGAFGKQSPAPQAYHPAPPAVQRQQPTGGRSNGCTCCALPAPSLGPCCSK